MQVIHLHFLFFCSKLVDNLLIIETFILGKRFIMSDLNGLLNVNSFSLLKFLTI